MMVPVKKIFLILIALMSLKQTADAQLIKAASVDNVGMFGGVLLSRVESYGDTTYRLHLPASYADDVIFVVGSMDEMILNVKDLYAALSSAERGDIFDFECDGYRYHLYFRRGGGSKWYDVYEEHDNIVAGRLFDRVLKAILKHYSIEE